MYLRLQIIDTSHQYDTTIRAKPAKPENSSMPCSILCKLNRDPKSVSASLASQILFGSTFDLSHRIFFSAASFFQHVFFAFIVFIHPLSFCPTPSSSCLSQCYDFERSIRGSTIDGHPYTSDSYDAYESPDNGPALLPEPQIP